MPNCCINLALFLLEVPMLLLVIELPVENDLLPTSLSKRKLPATCQDLGAKHQLWLKGAQHQLWLKGAPHHWSVDLTKVTWLCSLLGLL